jgi:hypothetical protein
MIKLADKILLTEIYPNVEKAFNDKKNVDKFKNVVGKFVDKNSESLSVTGPMKLIIFSDSDINAALDIIGMTQNEVKKIKSKSKDIKSSGHTMSYPMNNILPLFIRYFHIHKNIDMVKITITYLALSMYPVLFGKYWQYGVNENIMKYTINELSMKYKIKQTNNLLSALLETTYLAYELKQKDLERGYDIDIVEFSLSVRHRINSLFKNISIEYYKNHKEQNYMNVEKDNSDEENYMESDSAVFQIDKIVNSVAARLVINGPNIKLITIAASNNRVSKNELRNYINEILIDENMSTIKELIEAILFLYIYDDKNKIEDINSNKFLIYCLDIYKRSNTVNKNIIKIKAILDKWLEDLGTYSKTQNKTTLNGFRRALYTFFVMSIQYVNSN